MSDENAGISGFGSIMRLNGDVMAAMENHGKRLDKIGKERQINDNPPITTTGLDIQDLYEKHVEGAVIPAGETKALHLMLQFPLDLVNGAESGELMLEHARKFATKVFGENAIFADRVDRDEKSQHVVDVFLTPIYEKTYKKDKSGKTPDPVQKVSVTRGLKALADKYEKSPKLRGQGQGLQDAWFEYLRDEMKLEGVVRGRHKAIPGEDRKTPEQLKFDQEKTEFEKQKAEFERQFERSKNMRKRSLDRFSKVTERENELDAKIAAFEAEKADLKGREAAFDAMKKKAESDFAEEQAKLKAEIATEIQIEEARFAGREKAVSEREANASAKELKVTEDTQRLDLRQTALSERENSIENKVSANRIINFAVEFSTNLYSGVSFEKIIKNVVEGHVDFSKFKTPESQNLAQNFFKMMSKTAAEIDKMRGRGAPVVLRHSKGIERN